MASREGLRPQPGTTPGFTFWAGITLPAGGDKEKSERGRAGADPVFLTAPHYLPWPHGEPSPLERGGFEPHFAPAGHRRPLRYLGRSMLPVFPGCQLVSTTTVARLSGLSEVCSLPSGVYSAPVDFGFLRHPRRGVSGGCQPPIIRQVKGKRKKETLEPPRLPGTLRFRSAPSE